MLAMSSMTNPCIGERTEFGFTHNLATCSSNSLKWESTFLVWWGAGYAGRQAILCHQLAVVRAMAHSTDEQLSPRCCTIRPY